MEKKDKKYAVKNLYVIVPSILQDKKIKSFKLSKEPREILKVVQNPKDITIGEISPNFASFTSIDSGEVIEKSFDTDFEQGKKYVNVFPADYQRIMQYLWDLEIHDVNNKELCNYIMSMKPDITYEELMQILQLLRKEASYHFGQSKIYKRKPLKTNE